MSGSGTTHPSRTWDERGEHVKHWCLAVAVLAGCAATGGGEYRRGTPAPVAPPFNPATDAPHTVGQPGHLRPQALPRSPHKRVLPPSTGPGIWSAEVPRATADDSEPALLGFVLPVPDGATDWDYGIMRECGATLQAATERASTAQAIAVLPGNRRVCVALVLYVHCIGDIARVFRHVFEASTEKAAGVKRLADSATTVAKALCGGDDVSQYAWTVTQTLKEWRANHREGITP
jgi:hypothetical protein